jgi:predicted CoA-binding protein
VNPKEINDFVKEKTPKVIPINPKSAGVKILARIIEINNDINWPP